MESPKEESYFARICTEECGGLCCDPWWGIISYTMVKGDGFSKLKAFRAEVLKGIKERELRIRGTYKTDEDEPQELFGPPERYNVRVTGLRREGRALQISILAMFAFRCRYFTDERSCEIHPSLLGGREIRPPHCGLLGSPKARPGERGYCRIIDAGGAGAAADTEAAIRAAIEVEKGAGAKHYAERGLSAGLAADSVMSALEEYAAKERKELNEERTETPGRNDPCRCGSGKKFKRCHGA